MYKKFKLSHYVLKEEYVTFNIDDIIAYSVHYPLLYPICVRVYLKNGIRFELDITHYDEIISYFDKKYMKG